MNDIKYIRLLNGIRGLEKAWKKAISEVEEAQKSRKAEKKAAA